MTQRGELERQIDTERRRIIQAARSDYDALRDQQKHFEALLNEAEREMLTTAEASVKLQDLQRQSDANRAIYEQFLARYKTTNEQRSMQTEQTRIVSFATVPGRPSRPSLPLLLAAIAVAALLVSASTITVAEAKGVRLPLPGLRPNAAPAERVDPAVAPTSASAPTAAPDDPTMTALLDLPVWAVMPSDGARSAGRPAPDIKRRLTELLDKVALTRGLRGRVVLILSGDVQHGRPTIAEALNGLALDRGMLSVLIQVEPQGPGSVSTIARAPMRANATMRTTSSSLQMLLSGRGAGPAKDVRSEFDIIVVDGTALQDPAEIAGLADHIDFAVFLVDERQDGEMLLRAMEILSPKRHIAKGVIVEQALAG
jgi:hypothetical protein